MLNKVKGFLSGRAAKAGLFLLMAGMFTAAFATTGGGTAAVDPSGIVSDVQAQMTSIITAGAALLGIGIAASVGWTYAKRFLRG